MAEGLNWEAALDYVGGDDVLLRQLLAVFLEECPRWHAELDHYLAAGNTDGIRRTAHKLKGALLNLGAAEAGAAALRIEALCRTGTLDGVETMVATLRSELDRVLPAVRQAAQR